MAGATKQEAVDNFFNYFSETLSCIAARRLVAFQESANLFKVFFDEPARLETRTGGYQYLAVTQIFGVVETEDELPFKVQTREYSYVFLTRRVLDHHGAFAYHWHPHNFSVRDPHLHITVTPQVGTPEIERRLTKAHFPTSRVCLEDFVLLLIEYYDIKPRMLKSRWSPILKRNKKAFQKHASWAIAP